MEIPRVKEYFVRRSEDFSGREFSSFPWFFESGSELGNLSERSPTRMTRDTFLPLPARLRQVRTYLPLLLVPAAMAAVPLFYHLLLKRHPDDAGARAAALQAWIIFFETLAPRLLLTAAGLYWAKAIYTRNPTYVILAALTVCLLLRELHWNPMIKKAIFPLLGICFAWLFFWRDIVDRPTENWRHTVFFVAAVLTYGLTQMVEKKVLGKYVPVLPYFPTLHSQYEEIVECSAHVLLLAAALLGSWRKRRLIVQ